MGKHCCWGTCTMNTWYSLPNNIKWIPFPKPGKFKDGMTELEKKAIKKKQEKTKRWIYLCGRKDFTSIEQVTQNTYICSLHFVNKIGTVDENDEPINALHTEQEVMRKNNRKRKLPVDRSSNIISTKEKKDDKDAPLPEQSQHEPASTSSESDEKFFDKGSQTIYDKYMLGAKIDTLLLRNEVIVGEKEGDKLKIKNPMDPEYILGIEKKCKFFIGLYPFEFSALYEYLGDAKFELVYWTGSLSHTLKQTTNEKRHFSPKEELFITLLRLRRGYTYLELSHFYDVSECLISSIFITWIQFLFLHFKENMKFPTKEELKPNLPKVFRSFKNIRCVIDCTEFLCESPRNYAQQGNVYSSYKSHTTLKALIAVIPNGSACFISPLYEGSIDDVAITEKSGFLDYLEPDDLILADKGFTIQELCHSKQASLNIPAFLGKRDRLAKEDLRLTKRIAKARIHVERFNERLKKFRLVGRKIPLTLKPLASQLVYVACCLVNFQDPLCV